MSKIWAKKVFGICMVWLIYELEKAKEVLDSNQFNQHPNQSEVKLVQYVIDTKTEKARVSPEVGFAISMLPEQAFAWPNTDRKEFGNYVFYDCIQ